MLTDEQVSHFFREGYVLVRPLVPPEAAERTAKQAHAALEQARIAHLNTPGCDEDEWYAASLDIEDPAGSNPDVHHLLWHPNVIAAARRLLGPELRIHHGMLAQVKPGGKGLPWHQDSMYRHILGGAINLFIAPVEITPEMGGLWVAPRSHLSGVLPSRTAPKGGEFSAGHRQALEDPADGMPLPTMCPGDACIFDRFLLHRSVPNSTGKLRLAYAAQMDAAHARYADGSRVEFHLDPAELAGMFGEGKSIA